MLAEEFVLSTGGAQSQQSRQKWEEGTKQAYYSLHSEKPLHSSSSYCRNASKIDSGPRNRSKCNKCAICPGNNTGGGRRRWWWHRPMGRPLPSLASRESRVNAFPCKAPAPLTDLEQRFFKAFSNARKRQWSNYLIIVDWTNCLFPLFSAL